MAPTQTGNSARMAPKNACNRQGAAGAIHDKERKISHGDAGQVCSSLEGHWNGRFGKFEFFQNFASLNTPCTQRVIVTYWYEGYLKHWKNTGSKNNKIKKLVIWGGGSKNNTFFWEKLVKSCISFVIFSKILAKRCISFASFSKTFKILN